MMVSARRILGVAGGQEKTRPSWVAKIVDVFKLYNAAAERRAAFKMLISMEDWQLYDIGVTRGDIHWAMSLPLKTDAMKAARERAEKRAAEVGADRKARSTTAKPLASYAEPIAPWLTAVSPLGPDGRPSAGSSASRH